MEAGRALSLSRSLLILLEEGRHSQGCHQHCDTGVKLHATTLSLSLVSLSPYNPPLTISDMSVALCIVTNVTRNTEQSPRLPTVCYHGNVQISLSLGEALHESVRQFLETDKKNLSLSLSPTGLVGR